MASIKIGLIFLLSAALTEVCTWTIDLPEARKYFFENADKYGKKEQVVREYNEMKLFDNIAPDSPHNSEQPQNARDDALGGRYADDYEYMSYMEKKVHGVVAAGSQYLEGLRRALESHADLLQNCSRLNLTTSQSPNASSENDTSQPNPTGNQQGLFGNQPSSSSYQSSISNQSGSSGSPSQNQFGSSSMENGLFNGTILFKQSPKVEYEACSRATRASEHVRRLAELALWATRELQDRHYEGQYDKHSEEEEAELLVRLAFFLERLAQLTGYEPEPEQFTTPRAERPSTTTARPVSLMGEVPDDIKNMMMNCLKSNSSEPATERCRFPLENPQFIKQMFNITESPIAVQPASTESYKPKDSSFQETFKNPSENLRNFRRQKRGTLTSDKEQARGDKARDDGARGKRGLLMNALFGQRLAHKIIDDIHVELEAEHFEDLHRRKKLFEKLAILKNSYKNLVEFIAAIRHRHELEKSLEEREGRGEIGEELIEKRTLRHGRHARSVEKPLLDVMKYYVKHKVWTNSNQENPGDLDVANHVTDVKISADEYEMSSAKSHIAKIQKRSIENKKVKHMKLPENPFQDLFNLVKHKKGVNYITDENETQKLRQFLYKIQHGQSSTAKKYAQKLLKRKTRSVKYMRKFLPSEAENPRQDISYYVKSKKDREYQNNPVQAAMLRANLEQIFQYPNIEVVRRYGFNFNPLIPLPLGYGTGTSFFGDL